MHLIFLPRTQACGGQVLTSPSMVCEARSLAHNRHQVGIWWAECEGRTDIHSTPTPCQTPGEAFSYIISYSIPTPHPCEVGFNIPNLQAWIEMITKWSSFCQRLCIGRHIKKWEFSPFFYLLPKYFSLSTQLKVHRSLIWQTYTLLEMCPLP